VTQEEKGALAKATASDLGIKELGGDPVTAVLTSAPGNGQSIGGIKVVTPNAWFAARPSGTEAVYKLYAESFKGKEHLLRVQDEAQAALQTLFRAQAPR
jgi:phosphoglucomutase